MIIHLLAPRAYSLFLIFNPHYKPQNKKTMFVPTLEDKGALKLFGNKFLNKCGGVSHFHSLPLQF